MRVCRQHGIAFERCNEGCDYLDDTKDSAVTESRSQFVAEPDGKLRISGVAVKGEGRTGDVVCQVEVRRGIDEHLMVTVNGSELLRMVHDVVYILAYGANARGPR